MSSNYDVIIVGGRVAGSATALLLARLGHRVLIIDRTHPTNETLSTHAIMRSGVLQLMRWGVLQRIIDRGTPPIRRITLGFGQQQVGFDFREEYGVDALYAPRRQVLDAELLDAAVAAGAEFRQGHRLLDLVYDDSGRVTGTTVATEKNQITLRAGFVVGADGMRSRVAAAVGVAAYETHPPASAMSYAYFAGITSGSYDSYFVPGLAAGFIPTNDGLTAVFTARPTAKGVIGDDEFYQLVAAASPNMAMQLETAVRLSQFYRTPGLPGFLRVPSGPGWALVGDAGFTKDPLSAHGISDALRDAELCATAIDAVLSGRESETCALTTYHKTRDRFALPLQRETRALAHYGWDETEASTLMRQLGKLTDEECRFLTELRPPTAAGVIPGREISLHIDNCLA